MKPIGKNQVAEHNHELEQAHAALRKLQAEIDATNIEIEENSAKIKAKEIEIKERSAEIKANAIRIAKEQRMLEFVRDMMTKGLP